MLSKTLFVVLNIVFIKDNLKKKIVMITLVFFVLERGGNYWSPIS